MSMPTRLRACALAALTITSILIPVAPGLDTSGAVAAAAPASSTMAAAAGSRKPRPPRSRSFSARSARVLSAGKALQGTPYRYGGATPSGFDCSGFTSYVYRKASLNLPHSATLQMRRADRIARRSARPGDLVFFRRGDRAYHVGIYAGGGRVLHSPRPGQRVKTARIWTRNVSFGRVL
jgi:peptidoglycan DL-endopeptidase CwlO